MKGKNTTKKLPSNACVDGSIVNCCSIKKKLRLINGSSHSVMSFVSRYLVLITIVLSSKIKLKISKKPKYICNVTMTPSVFMQLKKGSGD